MAVVYFRSAIVVMLEMRFLTSLSICLISTEWALGFSPCCLPFLSHQMVETAAWKTYLSRNRWTFCLVWSLIRRVTSFHLLVYCTDNSFWVRFLHISSEKLHSEKRWFRVSSFEHRRTETASCRCCITPVGDPVTCWKPILDSYPSHERVLWGTELEPDTAMPVNLWMSCSS